MSGVDHMGQALLRRARLEVAGGDRPAVRLTLDGWPLVSVDLEGGWVAVNDLRRSAMYAHATPVGAIGRDQELRVGAVGDELYLLVGEVATVFVVPEPAPCSHAEVAVVESDTGRLLLERNVRYRQVPSRRVSVGGRPVGR